MRSELKSVYEYELCRFSKDLLSSLPVLIDDLFLTGCFSFLVEGEPSSSVRVRQVVLHPGRNERSHD